jgi:hypothetical protein
VVSTHGLRGSEEGKELLGVATGSTNPLCRAQLLHPRSFDCLDSSKCVEGEFCELRLYGVLRSSPVSHVRTVMCIALYKTGSEHEMER